jgi:hypothetical protein
MSAKKIIIYIFIGIVGLLIGKLIIPELFDSRPFKFEKYKTDGQLKEVTKLKFPLGSDLDKIINAFEKSGADCYTYKHGQSETDEIEVSCEYITGLFSLHPLEDYEIWLRADKDHKLLGIESRRIAGLMLITI